LLSELRETHDQMRAAIAELAGILSDASPDLQALARTRMKLTRLSGKWRTFVQCVVLPEIAEVPMDQARLLAELRREAAELAVAKADHIARWSARATEGDIAGYRLASAEMRRLLLARLDLEAAILYPLLQTIVAPGARRTL